MTGTRPWRAWLAGGAALLLVGATAVTGQAPSATTLHEIVITQEQLAQQLEADVVPFEVRVDVGSEDVSAGRFSGTVQSLFDAPGNDVSYVRVTGLPGQPEFKLGQGDFVLGACYNGGAPPPPDILARYAQCGQPTGEPEEAARHRPLNSWNVDGPALFTALSGEASFSQIGVQVLVTTGGRLQSGAALQNPSIDRFDPPLSSALVDLPAEQPLVLAVSLNSIPGRYLLIDAAAGSILASGTHTEMPPA